MREFWPGQAVLEASISSSNHKSDESALYFPSKRRARRLAPSTRVPTTSTSS